MLESIFNILSQEGRIVNSTNAESELL